MASKRSQLILKLGIKACKGIYPNAEDDTDISDFETNSVSSAAPSLSKSNNDFMDDLLTQCNIKVLGKEEKDKFTEKWISSQSGVNVNVSKSTDTPRKLVDYSPSLTASSRMSNDSKASSRRNLFQTNTQVFKQPQNTAWSGNEMTCDGSKTSKTLCVDSKQISPSTKKNEEYHSVIRTNPLLCSSQTSPKPEIRNQKACGISKGFSDGDEKSSQTPVSQRKCRSRPQTKKDSPRTFATENKENLVSRNSSRRVIEKEKDSGVSKDVEEASQTPQSKRKPRSRPPTREQSPDQLAPSRKAEKEKDCGISKDVKELSQTQLSKLSFMETCSPSEIRAPSPDLFASEDEDNFDSRDSSGKAKKKNDSGVSKDVEEDSQTPQSKRKPRSRPPTREQSPDQLAPSRKAEKEKDCGIYKDVKELSQTQLSKLSFMETCSPSEIRAPSPDLFASEDEDNFDSRYSSGKAKKKNDSGVSKDVEEASQTHITPQSKRKPRSQPKTKDMSPGRSALKENVSSCSRDSSQKAGNKNDSGISKDVKPCQTRRKTRSRPSRALSPDMFASEEENWGSGNSDSSLILDSPSSSSSASVSSVCRKRRLEVSEMVDDSDEERNVVPQKKQRKKKSVSKLSKEEKSMRQHLRNSGQSYETYYSGKKKPARQRQKPHECKRGCHTIITDDVGDSIFYEYWEQASYEKRVAYIAARIESCPVKAKRPRLAPGDPKSHPKSVMWKYCFHINGEAKQVCKETFLRTLNETDGFLRFVVKKKMEKLSGVIRNDKRGKLTPKHKLTPDKINQVTQHIMKFPSYKSHYKRAEVGDTRYLPSHLNIKKMHDMYISEGGNVSYSSYERIFHTLGRSFRKPPTDTCAKCDAWKQKVEHSPDEETKEEIQKEWNVHLDRAQAAYDLKRNYKAEAANDPTLRVLIFDLEQVLETPLLSTGETFYLRQLSTYNLTIYDTSSKLTHCYMWCELDAKRGANEIASCIFVHCLDNIPASVKKVVLFSDSTIGQNRNSIVSAMFLTLLEMHSSVKTIEHVFLEAGHTRLEVDSKHSIIERSKNHVDKICEPADWYELIKGIGVSDKDFPNGRFKVTEMKGDIYDFQSLLKGPLVKRNTTTTDEKFVWLSTPLLRYDANKPGKVFFKKNLKDVGYCCLSFQRSGKVGAYSAQHLQPHLKRLYTSPLPVSENKKKDLMKLLKFLPQRCHDSHKSIKSSTATESDEESNCDSE
ncbi:Tyrosine-protein phosphatase non-receptor type 14 [Frankliniella fusca]|uniref:Tyrosine-protein phosphatase non-receptor type 14 n=1 Tax=Frankliniella fusca TaxID=407009 RepID=A0AAE1LQX1_9NEOP|nr:Tyrosine-protein phosphatase non-receptor type 14 [Frankliniella fusca]KAK3931227.1 Tyrosine-protein phosphatase non-receptor type 14 [Frankliniella fusca]